MRDRPRFCSVSSPCPFIVSCLPVLCVCLFAVERIWQHSNSRSVYLAVERVSNFSSFWSSLDRPNTTLNKLRICFFYLYRRTLREMLSTWVRVFAYERLAKCRWAMKRSYFIGYCMLIRWTKGISVARKEGNSGRCNFNATAFPSLSDPSTPCCHVSAVRHPWPISYTTRVKESVLHGFLLIH